MPDDDAPREFVIRVRRRWTLWILPVIALLYFAFVVYLAVARKEVANLPMQTLVLAGIGLFALVFLVEIPFLFRRKARAPAPEPAPPQEEPSLWAPAPAEPMRATADDEFLVTTENQQGLRVLEYSAPAKSRHRGAVYAKTYVPVTKEHVLRVETLAAEGADL